MSIKKLVQKYEGEIMQCHALGRYLAELILGTPPVLDLAIFSPNRILENKPVFEGHGKLV